MTYTTRNSFYLRISKTTVLPLYIYLDERHVSWMSDKVLQHVLSDLRPNILSKLKIEADIVSGIASAQKKATVDTHRGDTYQFCYFIRKTEPHSVLIKSRTFTAAPPQSTTRTAKSTPSQLKKKFNKRKKSAQDSLPPIRNKKRKTKRKTSPEVVSDVDDVEMHGVLNIDTDNEEYLPDNSPDDGFEEFDEELQIEDEEEKPKPILGLTYQGFNIYGHCLCVVVEPWPVVRSMTAPPFLSPVPTDRGGTASNLPSSSNISGHKAPAVPLFLPEEPDRDESEPLAYAEGNLSHINKSYLNQLLNETDSAEEEEDIGGMMEFSQILYNIGDLRAGAVNDDDDADGSILFGDADEFKEL